MTLLDKINKRIYYTYHSKKNKEPLPLVLTLTVFASILNKRIEWWIVIWVSYFLYTVYNNNKLQNDPENLKERELLLKIREEILNGNIKDGK